MTNETRYWLKKQLNSTNLKCHSKCVLYKTLIRPILTYGNNVGLCQRNMKKCSESLKEEY